MLVVSEVGRAREQLDRLLHLVSPLCELACAATPGDGFLAQPFVLTRVVAPDEVGVLRPNRLRVVVGEQRRVLVTRPLSVVQPIADACMKATTSSLRDAGVGDLARERVLDCVLALADDRRASSAPDEVPLLEEIEVGLVTAEEMDHGARPEHMAHDRRCLERRFLARRQAVDARREHCVHAIRHDEPVRQLAHDPRSSTAG